MAPGRDADIVRHGNGELGAITVVFHAVGAVCASRTDRIPFAFTTTVLGSPAPYSLFLDFIRDITTIVLPFDSGLSCRGFNLVLYFPSCAFLVEGVATV